MLIDVPDEGGAPDGLTVDADGDLWVAIFGGGRVQRYSPDGVLRSELLVPAARRRRAPSVARAWPLYVTTATEGWSDQSSAADDRVPGWSIGSRPDATGRPAAPVRPDPRDGGAT